MNFPKNLNESLFDAWNEPEKIPEMHEWLQQERDEEACSQYALIILKKHFVKENLPIFEIKSMPKYWGVFCCDLYANVNPYIQKGAYSSMITALFAELTEFCKAAFPTYFVYYLKMMLENFLDFFEEHSKIEPFLPQKALDNLGKIKMMMSYDYEANLQRQIEMGY